MSSVLSSVLATDESLLHSYECGPNDTNPMFRVKHLVTGSEYVKMLCQCNPPLYAVLATEDAEWLRVLPVRPKWLFHPKKREVIGNVPGTNYRLHTIIAYRMYTEVNGLIMEDCSYKPPYDSMLVRRTADKLDHRRERIVWSHRKPSSAEPSKDNRKPLAAVSLPEGITHDMLPPYVVYREKKSTDDPTRTFAQYFAIVGHPKLTHCVKSCESMSISLLDKLNYIKGELAKVESADVQDTILLPKYVYRWKVMGKPALVYQRVKKGQPKVFFCMTLKPERSMEEELVRFKTLFLEKYPGGSAYLEQ